MAKIAIMGTGMVGGALERYFKAQNLSPGLYDPPKGLNDTSVLGQAEVVFVAVPTPFYLPTGQAGLDGSGFDESYIRQALDVIPAGKIVVLKSTILPGTTEKMQALYPQHRLLFNPEFLVEATADYDMLHPTRQIVGYTIESYRDAALVMGLLPRAPFERIVPARQAETVKYFGNALLALKVAFANQFYDFCQRIGVDYDVVKECAKADPRVGNSHLDIFHNSFRGYGGKCFPKDVRSLVQQGQRVDATFSILEAAEIYNNTLVQNQGMDIKWEEGSPRK